MIRSLSMSLPMIALSALLTGCMSPYGWADDDYYYASAYPMMPGAYYGGVLPISWWGSNAASINVFYDLLGSHGRWMSYGNYGRVFIPHGVVAGWQPYSRGNWYDDGRYGRMWQSADPWGWATDHYGRWGHDSRLGWFWVPDTRFGPGWVDWKTVNGQRSWAPMAPQGWNAQRHGPSVRRWISAPNGNVTVRPSPRQNQTSSARNRSTQTSRTQQTRTDSSRSKAQQVRRQNEQRQQATRPDSNRTSAGTRNRTYRTRPADQQTGTSTGRPPAARSDATRPAGDSATQRRRTRPEQARPERPARTERPATSRTTTPITPLRQQSSRNPASSDHRGQAHNGARSDWQNRAQRPATRQNSINRSAPRSSSPARHSRNTAR